MQAQRALQKLHAAMKPMTGFCTEEEPSRAIRHECEMNRGGVKKLSRRAESSAMTRAKVMKKTALAGVENVGSLAQTGQRTVAEQRSVSQTVRKMYAHYYHHFSLWKSRQQLTSHVTLDMMLADYLDVLLLNGLQVGEAEKTLAAVVYFTPGMEAAQMTRCKRSLKGFRKARPGRHRLPLYHPLVCGIAAAAMSQGRANLAIAIYATKQLYLRTGEMLGIRREDLGMPIVTGGRDLNVHTLTIASQHHGVLSKSQGMDEVVPIDDPPWLGKLIAGNSCHLGPSALLFQLTSEEFKAGWEDACGSLSVVVHPHQLRHTAASDDALKKKRSLNDQMIRGRWRNVKSVRRYSRANLTQRSWHRVRQDVQDFCLWAEENMEGILKQEVPVRRLPPRSLPRVSLVF
mmetsp:Transcript_50167/g.79463  ORF Transcript_50167/g.79463 Transcript_50167/m.79463 type:complete len:401 (+) Transcript_50167:178-1380(+)